jgi:hypothetical protein
MDGRHELFQLHVGRRNKFISKIMHDVSLLSC